MRSYMHTSNIDVRVARLLPVASVLLALVLMLGAARSGAAQSSGMPSAGAEEEEEVPHPFFTHMGLPEGVGVYSLRILGIAPRVDGQNKGDFAFHFETGITQRLGLHIRNDRFRNNDRTEAMFQFAAFVSKDGMTGFAPLIEFEIPTRSGVSRINSLVGFTTSTGSSRWAFNQVVHYDPREDMIDGSVALVVKAGRYVSPVVEFLGEGGVGQTSAINMLAGIKVRVREGILLGIAYQIPITERKEFTRQLAFGPDFGWKR